MHRDTERYIGLNKKAQFQEDRIETKKVMYKAGSKNVGGAAFNIVTLDYETNPDGKMLSRLDNDAMVRALIRSKKLDGKNNGEYNILTGVGRPPVAIPSHERYNPISNAGAAVMSSGSRRSQITRTEEQSSRRIGLPPSGSQRSQAPIGSVRSQAPTGSQRSQAPPAVAEIGSRRSQAPQSEVVPASRRSGVPQSERVPSSRRSGAPQSVGAAMSRHSGAPESSHSRLFGN